MPTFPPYDPITIYSKPTGNDRKIGRLFHKIDTKRFKAQLTTLLGVPAGSFATATTKKVQAVQQPSSTTIDGAAGANGGIMPIMTYTHINRLTTVEDVNSISSMLLDPFLLTERDYATPIEPSPTTGQRASYVVAAQQPLLDISFYLDISVMS